MSSELPPQHSADFRQEIGAWRPILLGACAGGMAWGIRGQYGHETGAMIAGLLLGATLALLLGTRLKGADAMRAVAWTAIAMGFGGSMTYGQTVGLTHDAELVGNHQALRWGMLGLALKGGLWIGFAGAFLGMGLGGKRYRALELALLWVALLAACWVGIRIFNEPFDPAHRILPRWYFSDDWRWEPAAALKPRREVWGGMLAAWLVLLCYARWRRDDSLALRLGLWGFLGGAIGFPLGQCLQAYHAWNLEVFHAGLWLKLDPLINWWNWMETTFGAVMGAVLGLGLWLNRDRIQPAEEGSSGALMPGWLAWVLLALHLGLLITEQFFSVGWVSRFYDFGLISGLIPIVAVAGSRPWCYWVFPLTVLPIAGKTLRELAYQQHAVDVWLGWVAYLLLPMGVAIWWVARFQGERWAEASSDRSLRPLLLVSTWIFFGLNFAFFRYPWPWGSWTIRTPNALAFMVCAAALTGLAIRRFVKSNEPQEKAAPLR